MANLITLSGFACSKSIMARSRAKTPLLCRLSLSQHFPTMRAWMRNIFSSDFIPLVQRQFSLCLAGFRSCIAQLSCLPQSIFETLGHLISKWTATNSSAILMVKTHMASTAKCYTIIGFKLEFRELFSRFDMAGTQATLIPAMLTVPFGSGIHGESPGPFQFFLSWSWLKWDNIFHAYSLSRQSVISQGEG